jgi:hypothetical protein
VQNIAFNFIALVLWLTSSCSPYIIEDPSELNASNSEKKTLTNLSDLGMFSKEFQDTDECEALWKKLLEGFPKPLSSYPLVETSSAKYGKNGLLYRNGIDLPFSGRIIQRNSSGIIILEASFLNGLPHGRHLRKNADGRILMESFFNRGILSGRKTKWWENGRESEIEYWENGQYLGKKVWDVDGRLLRAEMVKL